MTQSRRRRRRPTLRKQSQPATAGRLKKVEAVQHRGGEITVPCGTPPTLLGKLPMSTTSHADPTATIPVRGYCLPPDDNLPGREPDVRCSNASTGGSLALYRTVVDGDGPPVHEHRHEDETIYVLDGQMEVDCGEDSWAGGPGTTFFLPRGLPHTFRSVGGPATIMFIVTPGHLDEFFRLKDSVKSHDELIRLVQRFF